MSKKYFCNELQMCHDCKRYECNDDCPRVRSLKNLDSVLFQYRSGP